MTRLRTFGSSLLNQGGHLEVVSRLLGYESTLTTERASVSLLDQTVTHEVHHALDQPATS